MLNVLAGPMDALAGPVDAWLNSVELPLQPIRPGAVAAAAIDPDPLYQRWASWMQQQGAAAPATLPTPVQAIRIGTGRDAWYLSASGHEVVMDLAATVRGLWPYERVTVAAYSNSQLSYVPSRAVLQSPVCTTFPSCAGSFNYEGGQSFTWYGHRGPLTLDAEALFVDAHIAVLDHGWEHIGHAVDVVGLASWGERLFAVTSNHVLWWRSPVAEDVPWHAMGHATSVLRADRVRRRALLRDDRREAVDPLDPRSRPAVAPHRTRHVGRRHDGARRAAVRRHRQPQALAA